MSEPKVILVTGASRGIGRALAVAAAREGHYVAVNYRSGAEQAEALASELSRGPGRAVALQADVAVAEEAERLVGATVERLGRLDCVVNNAGIGAVIALDALDAATFSRTLHANLTSAFLVSQAAWPHMAERGGRLVFLSSSAARTGGGLSAAYAASKAGVEGLMHYYATTLRQHRITANAIAPTLVESDMARAMALPPPETLPLGRLGRPDELWPALRMILETEYLTGQTIHVDAGRYMT
ncbi:SDR family NAD(P)-dependent oxidoreductase (plasmid) [Methylobacterium sp. NMS12]|uniref:SDR family NAD(P)-dependent oxidoreductase n=1 Tax=Methylobacterium sp. NMS12 TaxID=3079766 RepID=UPI003F880879